MLLINNNSNNIMFIKINNIGKLWDLLVLNVIL